MSYLIAQTLTACVDGVGPSMGGLAGHYTIKKFHLGHEPALLDVPNKTVQAMPLNRSKTDPEFVGDLSQGYGKFYTGNLSLADFVWSGGKLLIKCILPPDVLAEPYTYSTLYLEDSNGNLSHGMVKLPDTVLPEAGADTFIYIEFPINTTANPPA